MKLKWKSTITRQAWVAPSGHAYGTYRIYRDPDYSIYTIHYCYTDGDDNLAEMEIGSRCTLADAKVIADRHHAEHAA